MTRPQVLQALLDAREPLDRIVINQGFGLYEDSIVDDQQCLRIERIVDLIVEVGNEIDAAGADN